MTEIKKYQQLKDPTVTIQAARVTREDLPVLVSWTNGTVLLHENMEKFTLQLPGFGLQKSADNGDWVVRSDKTGIFFAVTDEDFNFVFEEVSE